MNVAIAQKTTGRWADLNPFNVGVCVEWPLQVRKADRGDRDNDSPCADAEYGCVDWYQYHDPADEDKTRQALCAAQVALDQYTAGAGLKTE